MLQVLLVAGNWHQENLGKLPFLLPALYETFSNTCKFQFISPFIVRNTTGGNFLIHNSYTMLVKEEQV